MRIRAVKPVFWRDRELAKAGDEARLFYIGLWMQADDAGYFRWNVDEIGADLYPFLPAAQRTRKIERSVTALLEMSGRPRLEILTCGHARLTRFLDHQKPGGGNKTITFADQHSRCLKAVPRTSGEIREIPDVSGRDRDWDGTGLDGTRASKNPFGPTKAAQA